MKRFSTIEEVRSRRWRAPSESWGLVPTMGFLHQGHLSLVRRAMQENDRVGVSIFVNPAQFNNPSDLENYPSDLENDMKLLETEGVDVVWTPTAGVMYPRGYQTYVEVGPLTERLEGGARPGHFRGVTTVVSKLLHVFEPRRAYFGQKDAQQALVVRRMVRDLDFNVEIVVCPTVREPDGLAMSSRNVRLTAENRKKAAALYRALISAKDRFAAGEREAAAIRECVVQFLASVENARIDYVSVAHPETLEELERIQEGALVSLAVSLDGVRLIDNITLAS